MRAKNFFFVILLGAIASHNCTEKKSPSERGVLEVSAVQLDFGVQGGSTEMNVRANNSWQISTNAGWLTVSHSGGIGSDTPATVAVTAEDNPGPAREAVITITSGELLKKVEVIQSGFVDDGIPRISIEAFRKKNDSDSDWYRLTGEIVSIENSQYGNLYMTDDEKNYIYVYGLAVSKAAANDIVKKKKDGITVGPEDYKYSTLGIKAGDIITIVAQKTTYQGIIETKNAYFENRKEGRYPGYSAAKASSSWLELPHTDGEDSFDYLCHLMDNGSRNYSIYYSKANRLASWVAYPLYSNSQSSRSNAYAFDPLIGEQDQPSLKSSYQDRKHDGEEFVRGHMVPSAERSGRSNLDVFLSTNIMPQSTELNAGVWADMESMARNWTKKCDTLYVVVGTDVRNARYKVKDTRDLEIVVPSGIYRAFLSYRKGNGYRAMAVYFNNSKSDAKAAVKSKCLSVDELEKKLGIDLFANLPDDIEKEVEAQNPIEDSWWW